MNSSPEDLPQNCITNEENTQPAVVTATANDAVPNSRSAKFKIGCSCEVESTESHDSSANINESAATVTNAHISTSSSECAVSSTTSITVLASAWLARTLALLSLLRRMRTFQKEVPAQLLQMLQVLVPMYPFRKSA